ncbi:MAG: MFS transporter, partial [Polyangiaceae bacterium]|nr:MFS transporter [Polyangiaceae bacterium]
MAKVRPGIDPHGRAAPRRTQGRSARRPRAPCLPPPLRRRVACRAATRRGSIPAGVRGEGRATWRATRSPGREPGAPISRRKGGSVGAPAPAAVSTDADKQYNVWYVIAAAAAGTVIEWYDFYIFGSLATILSGHFFPKDNPTAAFLSTLATFATGFILRPFGAVVFGRIGDLVGRKYAFLLTLLLMGAGTAAIGVVPSYERIGLAAPLLLLFLRLLQGLALGGEYGGAAVYVAEHVPDHRRGFYTSFIQITATAGLFISLGVILAVRLTVGEDAFKAWAFRVPFLASVLLLGLSLFIRLKLRESPLFTKLKASGKASKAPIRDSLGSGRNFKLMALALFGATAGQGVVWYTGQFYALYFLQNTLKIDFLTSNVIVSVALLLGAPFFVLFGWLSDRIGRKKIMMTGNLLAVLTYLP